MAVRKKPQPDWSPFGLIKCYDLPGGHEYLNFPSMLARRVLQYAFTLGEMIWKPGQAHHHPLKECPFHDDRGFLFHYVLSGRLTHQANDQCYVASRDDAVVLDLRTPVRYFNETSKPTHLIWIWFDGIGVAEIMAELRVREEPVFKGLLRNRILAQYRQIVASLKPETSSYEMRLSGHISLLLAELCENRPPSSLLSGGPNRVALSPWVRKAVTTIARRYAKNWTTKELSSISGLSVSYFVRTFHRETGLTPTEYLRRYRVEQAKMLLASTRMSIEEIAGQVGLTNRKNFAKVFHQVAGRSPSEFRAQATGEE